LDAEQRPLTQLWDCPQQTELPQHFWVGPQLVVPQQVCAGATQNFVGFVLQQVWLGAHEVLPQQWPAETEQNLPPPLFVQQDWAGAHEVLPQHEPAETEQNLPPALFVQQVWLAAHEVLPQQVVPALIQKVRPEPAQQVWPGLHAGLQSAAFACRVHRPANAAPNTNPVMRCIACRRGIGLARMREASSNRLLINLPSGGASSNTTKASGKFLNRISADT
jgi:hypothetical protein